MSKRKTTDEKPIWLPFPKSIRYDDDLNPVHKLTICIIALLDNKKGCFISNKTLAKYLNVSLPTLIKAIAYLKKKGYIKSNLNRAGTSNVRRISDKLKTEIQEMSDYAKGIK